MYAINFQSVTKTNNYKTPTLFVFKHPVNTTCMTLATEEAMFNGIGIQTSLSINILSRDASNTQLNFFTNIKLSTNSLGLCKRKNIVKKLKII